MTLYQKIANGEEKISLVGLGYVGMPMAVAFSKKGKVIGFDLNKEKIEAYLNGKDPTNEVGDEEIQKCKVDFTSDESRLKEAKFHIVAVPTPVNQDKTPNLDSIVGACTVLGRNLVKESIVVFESTVYPGVTEDICIPVLEKASGLKCGRDFRVGYSPERINPGDKVHRLENIVKIVSGMDEDTLEEIANVYSLVISAGVYKASCIKVAEAAKVVENSQRDINIAFMNELAMVFDKMDIDTEEVLEAMNTKWNALGFRPGLVGGHCIGVDPYYFVYQAENLGYHSQIIASGRKVNDGMGGYVGDAIIKQLVLANKVARESKVVIMGVTFKENCPDIRNSRVVDIVSRLQEYGITPIIVDPWANPEDAKREYGIELLPMAQIQDADCVVLAVAHKVFRELTIEQLDSFFAPMENSPKIIIDVKSILDKKKIIKNGYSYWRL